MALVKNPRCPFCHEDVVATDPKRACEPCMAWHHRDCWSEGGERCAACGATPEVAPPPAGSDLTAHLEDPDEPASTLERPECCQERPCARHAVLAAVLLTLDLETLRKVARRRKLALASDCSAVAAREVLRAVDVDLRLVLGGLSKPQLQTACEKLDLHPPGATKRTLQEQILARSQLFRVLNALPLSVLRALADARGLRLSDRRWAERVRRDLLLAPDLDLGGTLRPLRRDDLAQLCRRLGLSPSGKKAQLRERLLGAARLPR